MCCFGGKVLMTSQLQNSLRTRCLFGNSLKLDRFSSADRSARNEDVAVPRLAVGEGDLGLFNLGESVNLIKHFFFVILDSHDQQASALVHVCELLDVLS